MSMVQYVSPLISFLCFSDSSVMNIQLITNCVLDLITWVHRPRILALLVAP